MESEESQISVWVCREEKLVLGLSRRTTCTDVVKVLLEDQNSQRVLSTARSYCIVEKWRGFERILPNKTKILRLWVAWGEEQRNVKFVLVKSEASLPTHAARSAEARVVLSKQSPCINKGSPQAPMGGIAPDKQRRVVRKAFRKLEKMNKKKAQAAHKDAARCAEKMETLVHVVVSRDHTIRQQVERLAELDAEIERCEAKVHLDRIKRHGANYVQDTYLVDADGRDGDELRSTESLANFEKYVQQCEEVVRMQGELWEQQALMDAITAQMQEELNRRWMQRRKEHLQRAQTGDGGECVPIPGADATRERELRLEAERIKTQLDTSSYIGLRLGADLEAIRNDLEQTREIYEAREKEMRDLLGKVNTLDIEGGAASEERCHHGADDKTGIMSTLDRKSEWVEQARGLSKAHSADDDSDTGLSSLHSQDSDSHTVWESLV